MISWNTAGKTDQLPHPVRDGAAVTRDGIEINNSIRVLPAPKTSTHLTTSPGWPPPYQRSLPQSAAATRIARHQFPVQTPMAKHQSP